MGGSRVRERRRGYSLPELLTTLAIVGILSAIALAAYSGLHANSKEGVARDALGALNRALLHFQQANWNIVLTAQPSSGEDELSIIRTLAWRDPNPGEATPGSPYLPEGFSNSVSSSAGDYRLRWNGKMFELLLPGAEGVGIVPGTPVVTPFAYPDNYRPLGPRQT